MVDEPDSAAVYRTEVADYEIRFYVELPPELITIEIVAKWGPHTNGGPTDIQVSVANRTVKPNLHVSFYGFECNRENILEIVRAK